MTQNVQSTKSVRLGLGNLWERAEIISFTAEAQRKSR
jgi:hypothetical protein